MDGLTFISELVKSLAWPMVAAGIVMLLRKPLGELVPLLKKLKFREFEAEFGEEVKKLEKEAERVLPTADTQTVTATDADDTLVIGDPRASVITSAIQLEHAGREALKRNGTGLESGASRNIIGVTLALNGILSDEQSRLFNDALLLGDAVADNREVVDYEQALKYVRIVRRLINYLNKRSS